MTETSIEWRGVPTHPGYKVTRGGQIRGPRKVLRPMATPTGHLYVLTYNRRPRKLFVHRAVLLTFVGPPPSHTTVLEIRRGRLWREYPTAASEAVA